MAREQVRTTGSLEKVDPVWTQIRQEAEEIARSEPELATFIYSTLLHHDTLEAAVVHRIAERLDKPELPAELVRQAYAEALKASLRSAALSVPISWQRLIAIPQPTACWSRYFITRAFTPSRLIGLRTGCGAEGARILLCICKPLFRGVSMRHPSQCPNRARHLP